MTEIAEWLETNTCYKTIRLEGIFPGSNVYVAVNDKEIFRDRVDHPTLRVPFKDHKTNVEILVRARHRERHAYEGRFPLHRDDPAVTIHVYQPEDLLIRGTEEMD